MNLRSERGSVLITATAAVAMMLVVGFATLALVDRQQRDSREQRNRESSLALNEAVLYSQAFILARNWPTPTRGVAGQFPPSCASTAATTQLCPDRNTLAKANSTNPALANFVTADYLANASWIAKVRDNGGTLAQFYDAAAADAAQAGCPVTPCTLDANGDRRLWVQVRTLVRDRPRSIAALLQLELFREAFPQSALSAGGLVISNQGNHGGSSIVDNTGSAIALRCDDKLTSCADYNAGQISQPTFTRLPANTPPALGARQQERLKARAILDGKYFATCPPNDADLSGAVVWVETCDGVQYGNALVSAPCEAPYAGNCINQPSSPGVLIWKNGRVRFAGNQMYHGLMYMIDGYLLSGNGNNAVPVIDVSGAFSVVGAITVDGTGRMALGSNAEPNFKFDPNVFNFGSYGTAGLVQNTWRELAPTA